jgi:hypothetical protein
MNGKGLESCQMAGFGFSCVEFSDSATTVFVPLLASKIYKQEI